MSSLPRRVSPVGWCHINESRHTYEYVMSYEWVMSHVWMWWMSHVTQMNESCYAYERVIYTLQEYSESCPSCVTWMRHATHMNASRNTYECVTQHAWLRHATHMNASCDMNVSIHTYERPRRTYECAMSHIQMRPVACINTPCHTYKLAMSHTRARCVTYAHVMHVTNMNESRSSFFLSNRVSVAENTAVTL